MDEDLTRVSKKVKRCDVCKVGIMTITTEAKIRGEWESVKVVRNCGHTSEFDPQ